MILENEILEREDVEHYLLDDWDEFVAQTECSYEHAVKALQKLREGVSLERIIRSYNKYIAKEKEFGATQASLDSDEIEIHTMETCEAEMLADLEKGKEKGSSTYIPELDNYWTWRLGEFNIWTGYANEGKSLFIRYLALIKAVQEDWKFAFYAPEDYPAKEFFDDLIHSAAGYSTDKDNPNFIGKERYIETLQKIKKNFFFVYKRPPKNDLITILKSFIPLIEKDGVTGLVLDPLIKMSRPKEFAERDDRYAAYVTTMCTDFSRRFNVSLHLVMHQLTPRTMENGLYPKPSMYYIKGGGTWADGCDNVLTVQRPFYALDKINGEVEFNSQKIKKQKLVGIPGTLKMEFDRRKNRYVHNVTKADLYDFDHTLDIRRMQLLFDH